MPEEKYDILIVGGGTAGMTAALYAKRAGKSVLLAESTLFGGQIAYAAKVENYPAMPMLSGAEYSERLAAQIKALGVKTTHETVQKIVPGTTISVMTSQKTYFCTALIVSAGLTHRKIGLKEEEKLVGHGVSYCATCDGAFFRNKKVAVYGGGNTALQDAIFLSDICEHVVIVHRRDSFRGDKAFSEKLKESKNVQFCFNSEITALQGETVLTGITVRNKKSGESSEICVDGLFIAIGQIPQNAFLQDVLALDAQGYAIAGEDCRSSIKGIFVAGDCRTKDVRQLTTAASDGTIAAIHACEYCNQQS